MDLASPAVSGTSVYANGLKSEVSSVQYGDIYTNHQTLTGYETWNMTMTLLEQLRVTQLFKQSQVSYGTPRSIAVFLVCLATGPYSEPEGTHNTLAQYLFNVHFNIILPSTANLLKWSPTFKFSVLNFTRTSGLPMHVTCLMKSIFLFRTSFAIT